jgi:hypothetical protein
MRQFFKAFFFITILTLLFDISIAQNSLTIGAKPHPKTMQKGFGNPKSISVVTDVLENN